MLFMIKWSSFGPFENRTFLSGFWMVRKSNVHDCHKIESDKTEQSGFRMLTVKWTSDYLTSKYQTSEYQTSEYQIQYTSESRIVRLSNGHLSDTFWVRVSNGKNKMAAKIQSKFLTKNIIKVTSLFHHLTRQFTLPLLTNFIYVLFSMCVARAYTALMFKLLVTTPVNSPTLLPNGLEGLMINLC
jgi:hypothetical protein